MYFEIGRARNCARLGQAVPGMRREDDISSVKARSVELRCSSSQCSLCTLSVSWTIDYWCNVTHWGITKVLICFSRKGGRVWAVVMRVLCCLVAVGCASGGWTRNGLSHLQYEQCHVSASA